MRRALGRWAAILAAVAFAASTPAQESGKTEGAPPRVGPAEGGCPCPRCDSAAPRPATILDAGNVTRKALKLPRPEYPEAARAAVRRDVKAEVVIDIHTGEVVWARVVSGPPGLREAVVKAACRARFHHAFINGPPARVSGSVTYSFPAASSVPARRRRRRAGAARPVIFAF